jgi:hypothetical protein
MTSEFVNGQGMRDKYLQSKGPVYRYHYFSNKTKTDPTSCNSDFDIQLNFGTSATLEPHKTWMLALQHFHTSWDVNYEKDVSLVIGETNQFTEKSNIDTLNNNAVFNICAKVLHPFQITTNLIGHKITNPNFLNSTIRCRLIDANGPNIKLQDLTSVSFTLLVYAYD